MPDLKDISDTQQAGAQAPYAGDGTSSAEVAQGHGPSDPFAPEGTDEKLIKPDHVADEPISEAESVKATKAALGYKTGHATTLAIVSTFIEGFLKGFFRTTPHSTHLRRDKEMRDRLDEDQIDSMIDDSFPASDPPSSY
ncbi:hypothetical protein [Asticcacaulis benevestitus]|uniref:Uncharacterized protein n=1 Tax=Asticcacaulis benevestitus DSM 16100 = ATCC BAA-896 TaxID=1121022 RepID=V4Q0E6_9CAUL|nr:hypothetical protein [Asticcacaulis benevestitus]ESQ94076.1 hypothetical protein ABENE_03020 [Asticcacaulis benevestitus DSM 16100 = ATCC BAA-896]